MPASKFMQSALAEAIQGQGTTSPNPSVGAVVVRDGEIVGRGHTQPPGGDHAEIGALREAGERARGATVYVTLEPCSHFGGTPPCTNALIAAGISTVHFALIDPNPEVCGIGERRLTDAGIEISRDDGVDEARRQLAGYLKHQATGLPLVVVKYAASLDGRIAASSGDSRWVSGPETLAWAQANRPGLDAIVVGSNTVVVDDPQLTARPGGTTEGAHQPLRIVLDSRGRTPDHAAVLVGDSSTLIATTDSSPTEWQERMAARGAEVLVLPAFDGRIDLEALIAELGSREMLTVLFEGGGVVLGSLFDRRLVDRVDAVIAPIIVGAADAPAAVAGRGIERMAQAPRLRDITVERLGDDTLISGTPIWPDDEATATPTSSEER